MQQGQVSSSRYAGGPLMSDLTVRVRNVTTALYRRYRPETFADVIGQEHVTEPLMQALRTGRVNHAYLFSGPRGCGKTTSARILARCLNCEQGPTPIPCGTCDSCVALARGGSGSVDVIEIDAASHGGVDDARDLRERASYGPAQSRFKIYIIDEAHMVTPQGFNALLKIVEEPPEHVKFVFATTEPEKVIGTIRSRTHHYPFRLVPPAQLHDYLARLCEPEGVAVAPGVLSLRRRAPAAARCVTRSRCSTSSSPGRATEGLTYEGAAALLGFTDGELLDATIDAFAAGDARRRLPPDRQGHRVRARPAPVRRGPARAAARPHHRRGRPRRRRRQVLRGVPEDQLERMRGSRRPLRPGRAVAGGRHRQRRPHRDDRRHRAAAAARADLRARPAARPPPASSGYAARLDRLERRLDVGGSPDTQPQAPPPIAVSPSPCAATPKAPPAAEGQGGPAAGEPQQDRPPQDASQQDRPQQAQPERSGREQRPGRLVRGRTRPSERPRDDQCQARPGGQQAPERPAAQRQAPTAASDNPNREASPTAAAPPRSGTPGGIDTDAIRRSWPDVLAQDLLHQAGDVDVPVRARAGPRLRRAAAAPRHLDDRAGQHLPQGPARRAGATGADRGARRRRRRRGHPDAGLRDRR